LLKFYHLKLKKELETRNEEFKELKALKDISEETNLRLSTEAGEKEKTRNKIRQEEKDNVKKEFFDKLANVQIGCLKKLQPANLKAIDCAEEFLKGCKLHGETLEQAAEKFKPELIKRIEKENDWIDGFIDDLKSLKNMDFVMKATWPDNEEYEELKKPYSQPQDLKDETIERIAAERLADLLFQAMNKHVNLQNKNKGALIQEKEALIKDEIWQDNVNFEVDDQLKGIDNTFNKDFIGNVEYKTEKM
jgi:hypothetical protein